MRTRSVSFAGVRLFIDRSMRSRYHNYYCSVRSRHTVWSTHSSLRCHRVRLVPTHRRRYDCLRSRSGARKMSTDPGGKPARRSIVLCVVREPVTFSLFFFFSSSHGCTSLYARRLGRSHARRSRTLDSIIRFISSVFASSCRASGVGYSSRST